MSPRTGLVLTLALAGCSVSHERFAGSEPMPPGAREAGDAGAPDADPCALDPECWPDPPPGYDGLCFTISTTRATACTPGTRRWCSDAVYDSGSQTCGPDGLWGPCVEPRVTSEGFSERPATACGCRYFYFDEDCCEDQRDRDCDGHADCLIPDDWVAPACESDGSLCSYCDAHSDCGGPADRCLFLRDGYAFCARDCTETPCPDAYLCQEIPVPGGTVHQCVPRSETCG